MTDHSRSSSSEYVQKFDNDSEKQSLIHINAANIIKLTTVNYKTWRLQITALLEAYELHGFIYETDQAPPVEVTTTTCVISNPKWDIWRKKDKLLYIAILGTLSDKIQPIVLGVKNTCDIWATHEKSCVPVHIVSSEEEEEEKDCSVSGKGQKRARTNCARVFSNQDEITIIQAMIEFKAEKGNSQDTVGFYNDIKGSLTGSVSLQQFKDKIGNMKSNFKRKERKQTSHRNAHELTVFEMIKPLWGVAESDSSTWQENESERTKKGSSSNSNRGFMEEFNVVSWFFGDQDCLTQIWTNVSIHVKKEAQKKMKLLHADEEKWKTMKQKYEMDKIKLLNEITNVMIGG